MTTTVSDRILVAVGGLPWNLGGDLATRVAMIVSLRLLAEDWEDVIAQGVAQWMT